MRFINDKLMLPWGKGNMAYENRPVVHNYTFPQVTCDKPAP